MQDAALPVGRTRLTHLIRRTGSFICYRQSGGQAVRQSGSQAARRPHGPFSFSCREPDVATATKESNPPSAGVTIWPHTHDVLVRNAGCRVTAGVYAPHVPHPSRGILHLPPVASQGDREAGTRARGQAGGWGGGGPAARRRPGGRPAGRQATEQWDHRLPLTSPTDTRRAGRWTFMLRPAKASIASNE